MTIFRDLTELIGKTPLIRLNRLSAEVNAEIIAKLEFFNPGSSVKDRVALSMIQTAENEGKLKPGDTIIEPTSGNTGIGLAWIGAIKGYKVILTMPETMSLERRKLLNIFGAQIVLTEAQLGMNGAIKKAEELAKNIKNSFMPQQFNNLANPEVHRQTTAQEIWVDTAGKIDVFVAGIGTGGTITGVGEELKKKNKNIKIIALEPNSSAVLSGKKPGPHMLQGLGSGFVPKILNRTILDEVLTVKDDDAFNMTKRLAKEEGLLVGISSGAAAWGAAIIAKRPENKGKVIVTVLPDTGERYLSLIKLFSEN